MIIGTLQMDLVWENANKNLINIENQLKDIDEHVDVLVLPEMFTSGFSMRPEGIAHSNGEPILTWMQELSSRQKACIVGSIAVEDSGHFFNRIYWVFPDGTYASYDKRHLFRMAGEDEVYTSGKEQLIVEYKGFRFMPMICYDVRFPVWSRNIHYVNEEPDYRYDCAIYVANWPAVRSAAWVALLQARAIENLCYVVGVNRVGEDGNGMQYDGKSRVFDAKGTRLDTHVDGQQNHSIVQLNMDELVAFRKAFPAHRDADYFTLQNDR
jgi:predicted amidohydrolase